jgi:hypothetical protein
MKKGNHKIIVGYYIRGISKQYKTFKSFGDAKIFMQKLANNPKCESYGIERNIL